MFDDAQIVGAFLGFVDSGMEFHADLVLPHSDVFHGRPMHGQFVIVELEHDREALLGRITMVASEGRLTSARGEDHLTRSVHEGRPIPEELQREHLRYQVDVRILGVLRQDDDRYVFVSSHRRLPRMGARVALPSDDLLAEIAGAADTSPGSVPIGYLALGEFVYAGNDPRVGETSWMRVQHPAIMPTFPIGKLVARRSFVFARAGFGKSNLVKLLFSELYRAQPTVDRLRGAAPVGTVVFDPDGEYFWPDYKGRPALADVEHLRDSLVVFTNRSAPSPFYESFAVGGVKLNIKELAPARVLGIALGPEKQDQQNVVRLKSLDASRWAELVDVIHRDRYRVDRSTVQRLLGLDTKDEAQTNAAIGNMARVVTALHDPASQLLSTLKDCLSRGKLCVVDISQMRGAQGLQLAGVILADIFEHNQTQFTETESTSIPTIAVIEEAQSVLGGSAAQAEDGPFVSWVKEGRKYDLGALLITQQPGSLPDELLSQGDNFFVFHLLSQSDLLSLKKANAHFSDDLLATLLNEPLVGSGLYWSSAPGTDRHSRPYPVSVRILSFEDSYAPLDRAGDRDVPDSFAARLRESVATRRREAVEAEARLPRRLPPSTDGTGDVADTADDSAIAIDHLNRSTEFHDRIAGERGIKWGRVAHLLGEKAPPYASTADERFAWGNGLVKRALDRLYPDRWTTEVRDEPGRVHRPTFVRLKRRVVAETAHAETLFDLD